MASKNADPLLRINDAVTDIAEETGFVEVSRRVVRNAKERIADALEWIAAHGGGGSGPAPDMSQYAKKTDLEVKLDKNQGSSNAGKFMTVGGDGNLTPTELDLSNYATKSDISAVVRFKGSVTNYSDLPVSSMQVGDTYNIQNADLSHNINPGDNVAWNGSDWDKYGGAIDLSAYIPINQGSGNAGKFMMVGSDGNVSPVAMQTWQGGSY